MDSNIPQPIQAILHHYISVFQKQIPETLEGLYIHGSIALEAYIPESSDIDFIAVINRQLTEAEIKKLAKIHKEIADMYKRTGMDGSYLLWEDMTEKNGVIKKRLYTNDGKLKWGEEAANPITWWILKNKGITILGPEVTEFDMGVDEQTLADYCLSNMNSYWFNRINRNKKFKRIAWLIPNKVVDWEAQWSVSGMLRQYYTLSENSIISKVAACEYALHHLPKRWHNIINEAITIRTGENQRYYKSKKERINQTIEFMQFILDHCNNK